MNNISKLGHEEGKICKDHPEQFVDDRWISKIYTGEWNYDQFQDWRQSFINGWKEINDHGNYTGMTYGI